MYLTGHVSFWCHLGSWNNFEARKQIIRQSPSREMLFYYFLFVFCKESLKLCFCSWTAGGPESPSTKPSSKQTTRAQRLISEGKLTLHKEYGRCLPPEHAALQGAGLARSQPAAAGPQNPHRVPGWAYRGQQLAGTALLQPAPPPAVGWRRAAFVLPPLQLECWGQVSPTYTLISPHTDLTHSLPADPPAPQTPSSSPGSQTCPKPPDSSHRYLQQHWVKPHSDLSYCNAKARIQPLGQDAQCHHTRLAPVTTLPKFSAPKSSFTALPDVLLALSGGRRQK